MSKQTLIAEITSAVVRFQNATERVDAAAAAALGINRTDLACIGLLAISGGMTAGRLATEAGLSPAATTTVIERLEAAGYAVRSKDGADRRRVVVTTTPLAEERIEQVYGPVLPAGTALLSRYTRAELETIQRFLTQGEELQDRQAERIRSQRTV
ncbi:MarR family transcriptional regulator [Kribbella sandramycini]|uniref:MarR family transcriptional regulator n=1 Tax=Kribbella sandramycini TaxID=60450 RepID=A0A7Y4L115_9ACTN|nr:DNA-binding MarR family transcriptional regulator [Kribbella sandramycini]NOL41577.1 MarR family transcriptional regulator [Kribbella sandramycini]